MRILGLCHVENCDNVGMIDSGSRASFSQESFARRLISRHVAGQDFDGHFSVERRISGEQHYSHATASGNAKDFIITQPANLIRRRGWA